MPTPLCQLMGRFVPRMRDARRHRLVGGGEACGHTGGAPLIHSDRGLAAVSLFVLSTVCIVRYFPLRYFPLAVFLGPCCSCFILPIMYQSMFTAFLLLTLPFNLTSLQVIACGDVTPYRCDSRVQSSDNCPLTFLHHGSDCGACLVYLGTDCHVTRAQPGMPGYRYSPPPESFRRSHLDIPISSLHLQVLPPASPSGVF
ncbi:hypothetical protein H4582DRAFT_1910281 [Lactarius indigo]|nr:hypothetical protein H4582DRAFT_1910281 [Lactarius indigo]